MITYTLVFEHNYLPAVRITIDVKSRLEFAEVAEDATTLIELGDDFIEGADLDVRDYSLIEVRFRGYVVAKFDAV